MAHLYAESNPVPIRDAQPNGYANAQSYCADRHIHTRAESNANAAPDHGATFAYTDPDADVYLRPIINTLYPQPVSDFHADADLYAYAAPPQPDLVAHVAAAPHGYAATHGDTDIASDGDAHSHRDAHTIGQVVQLDAVPASFVGQLWTQEVFVVEY